MNSKHTPGPWAVRENIATNDMRIGPPDKVAVAILRSDAHAENLDANARLIAAAPDLLAELHGLCNAIEMGAHPDEIAYLVLRSRNAIADARGEG